MLSGAEAVARTERVLVERGFAADPSVAEGTALAGVRAASLSDGSALSTSDAIALPEVSCVHHVVAPAARARGTVFELAATSPQETIDHCLLAHVLSARLRRPGLCSLDRRLAECLALVSLPDASAVEPLLREPESPERRLPDASRVLEEARRAAARVASSTGRAVPLAELEGDARAEIVFAGAGSEAGSARAAARRLREAGVPAAALSVALVHPFPEAEVRALLEGARTAVWVRAPDAGTTLPTRLRASAGERTEVRTVSATSPERMLEELGDLLGPKGVEPATLVASDEPLPRGRLGVVPVGPWSEETLREILAACSRLGPLRMGPHSRLEAGATCIEWEAPADGDANADLLVASHPAALEADALALLRPGGAVLVLVAADSEEEWLRWLSPDVLEPLREQAIRLHRVSVPGAEEAPAAIEGDAGAPEMERAAALVLSGAAAAIVGGSEGAREVLAGEDPVSRWLCRGAQGVRVVDPARLASASAAEEIDFRAGAGAPRLPAPPEPAGPEERAEWRRAIHRFHRTGRASVRFGPRLPFRPASLDGLVAQLRDAPVYPLVVTRAPDAEPPLSARPLSELLDEALESLPEPGVLGANRGAVAPMASRLLREAGGSLPLDALLIRMSHGLGRALGLRDEEKDALERELEAARERLPAEARAMTLRADLPIELHAAAVEAVRAPLRNAFHARLRALRERLRDQLQLGLMASPDGRSPGRLAAELGGGAARLLDPEALSRTLPPGGGALAPERRRRLEEALSVVEAELEQGADERVRVLYFTPPGVELPGDLDREGGGLQCEHPDPLAAAVGCFDAAALRMAPLFRAVRIAELELDGRYRPEVHDAPLAELDWQGLSAEELALVPPVAVVTNGRRLRRRALGSLSDLLQSSRPVHVLVRDAVVTDDEASDPSRFHLDLGVLVMAHREAFAVASSLARPERTAQALVDMARAARPGVAVFHLASPELDPWYPLLAEAALQGRACPEFVYDPDAGTSWAGRFDVETNPQPDRAWPARELDYRDGESPERLELAFTFAEAVALEPGWARHLRVIPRVAWDDELQRPLPDYLDRFDPEGRDRSVPYLWALDAGGELQRTVVTRALAMAARDRLRGWRVLQELAGYENAHAERAAAAAREQALAAAARERTALERAHADALASARGEGAREAMERLAAALIRGDALSGAAPAAPAAQPAAAAPLPEAASEPAGAAPAADAPTPEEAVEEPLVLDEPYVDSALCTSCNECTQLNGRMFQYNADKQAFLADPAAGTYAELVRAAELCPARCIHPGRPRSDDATATPELVERAAAFD